MKTLQDIAKLHTLAEAKLVLLLMRLVEVNGASIVDLCTLTGLPQPEVAQGAHLLKVLGVNVAKGFDHVILAKEWETVAKENDSKVEQ